VVEFFTRRPGSRRRWVICCLGPRRGVERCRRPTGHCRGLCGDTFFTQRSGRPVTSGLMSVVPDSRSVA